MWAEGALRVLRFSPSSPIEATVLDDAGELLESYQVMSSRANGSPPTGLSSGTNQTHYVAWTRRTISELGQLQYIDRYHNIPSSGLGTLSTDYHRTIVNYDTLGRKEYTIQVVSGTAVGSSVEQITQFVYDSRDRVTEIKRGVSSASHSMGTNYTTYPTLVTTSKTFYDDGDGHVVTTQRHFGTGANDFTSSIIGRTFRGHVRYVTSSYQNGGTPTNIGPFVVMDIDWMGRTKAQAMYDLQPNYTNVMASDTNIPAGYKDYTATTTDRRTLTKTFYDDLGRVYQTERYEVAESNGAAGSKFVQDNYYDRESRLVATLARNGVGREIAYDGAGRQYQQRLVHDLDSTKYSSGAFNYQAPMPNPAIGSMSGGNDQVIEIDHLAFDKVGNEIERHSYELNHSDTSSIGISLTNNDYVRRSVFTWYDLADRATEVADHGSGDTTAGAGSWKYANRPTRGSAPSASTDFVLLTKYGYNPDTGLLETVTHPDGTQTKTFYDKLGRTRHVAENYANFDPATPSTSGDGTDKSKDRVTETQYNGLSQVTKLIAQDQDGNGTHTDDETTTYLYENTVNAGWVTNEIYPDSSDTTSTGTDQIKKTYNVDGSLATRTDQNQTVLTYVYDNRRKLKAQKATTLGSNVDGAVRSITYGCDDLARRQKVTSHTDVTEDPNAASNIHNQVYFAYDDFGALATRWENHSGLAVTSGGSQSPKSQFGYDTSATSSIFTNGRRLSKVTYPAGRVMHYTFGDSSVIDEKLNRIVTISDDASGSPGNPVTYYNYNGARRLMLVDLGNFTLDYSLLTSNNYSGWDRFGRVVQQRWRGNTVSDADRFYYAYDYAGNPKYRDIDASIYGTNNKDQVWTYDGLERLKTMTKGNLVGTSISTVAGRQDWTLDALGNWSSYKEDNNGSLPWVLDQGRTPNLANEITAISATTGTDWYDPTFNAAGNMVTGPKPADPGAKKFQYTYDAWQRLVKVEESPTAGMPSWTNVATYKYNGLNERIVKVDIAASPDVQYDYYYNHRWQVLEVRKDGSANPLEQNVWHPYYIDALGLRYYDSDTSTSTGVVAQYCTHDANLNVTALMNATGGILERYDYDPYGKLQIMDGSFANRSTSSYEFSVTYAGYRFDAETGLYQVRNRYLDPGLGRWVTRDPIGYRGGNANLLAYAGELPTGLVDPFGLQTRRFTCKNPVNGDKMPMSFNFKNCTKAQQDKMAKNACKSLQLAQQAYNALSEVRRYRDGTGISKGQNVDEVLRVMRVFDQYFSEAKSTPRPGYIPIMMPTEASMKQINKALAVFAAVAIDMQKYTIEIDCESRCDEGKQAYIHGETWFAAGVKALTGLDRDLYNKALHICPDFWKKSERHQIAKTLHEVTHIAADTEDHGYRVGASPFAAIEYSSGGEGSDETYYLSEEELGENADTYSYFAVDAFIKE